MGVELAAVGGDQFLEGTAVPLLGPGERRIGHHTDCNTTDRPNSSLIFRAARCSNH